MRRLLIVAALTIGLGAFSSAAHAGGGAAPHQTDTSVPVATVVSFDPAAGQFPEGIAVDKRGTVYVTLITPRSQLVAIDPNRQQRLVATLPGTTVPGPIGL